MVAHREELEIFLENTNPALLLLSETRTNGDIEDAELQFQNYITLKCDSDTRRTGGVAALVHKDLKFKVISNVKFDLTCWF